MAIVFLIIGFMSAIMTFVLEGGHIQHLLEATAALVVIGGTIGATGLSVPMHLLKNLPGCLKVAFTAKPANLEVTIEYLKEMANKARREGLLSLEEEISSKKDMNPFLLRGLLMIVDGVDPETIREILDTQIDMIKKRHKENIHIFETAGGLSPTMGIIGTVMGLVHVLGNLSNPDTLGPSIAVAFIATLYGVALANLVYLPIASRLKMLNESEVTEKQLMEEGVLSIIAGENPNLMVEKLKVFLEPSEVKKMEAHAKKEEK